MCNCNSCILACMPWFCMLSVNEETLFFCECFPKRQFHAFIFHLYSSPSHPAPLSTNINCCSSGIIGSCTWRPFSSARKFVVVINYQHFTRIHTNNLAQNCERKVFISFHTILHIRADVCSTMCRRKWRKFSDIAQLQSATNDDDPKNCRQLFVLVTRSPMMLFFLSRSEMGFLIKFPHNRTCRVLIFHRAKTTNRFDHSPPFYSYIYMFKTFVYVCAT